MVNSRLRAAVARNPSAAHLMDLGILLGRLERWDECVRALERAVESAQDPELRSTAARALEEARARHAADPPAEDDDGR